MFFLIGRFITNQQNIYRVIPVHYLQKAEKKTWERTIQYRRGKKRMATTLVCWVQHMSTTIKQFNLYSCLMVYCSQQILCIICMSQYKIDHNINLIKIIMFLQMFHTPVWKIELNTHSRQLPRFGLIMYRIITWYLVHRYCNSYTGFNNLCTCTSM